MSSRRKFLAAAACGGALPLSLFTDRAALAQSGDRTDRLARMIVPFPAGGGTDAVARLLVDKLRAQYAGGLIVDNRPGASGRLGTEYVKNQETNGLNMLLVPDFVLTVYPYSFRKLNYSPLTDFAPVALVAKTTYALTAGPALPANVTNLQQFIEWAKAHPKLAAFASTSAGSPSHFTGLMLARSAGIDLLHVPYKGGAAALQDLLAGQVPVSINPVGEVLPQLASNRLRVLATTGAVRSRFLPDVPTFVEAGHQQLVVDAWLGVLMPAKTPSAVIAKASDAINAATRQLDASKAYSNLAMEAVTSTPVSFAATVQSDMQKWEPVIKASGFTAED